MKIKKKYKVQKNRESMNREIKNKDENVISSNDEMK